ncbi:unnamed protein product [Fraxinus pennsylvanica]|uniref:NFD4 C-terminal domain-containing protein n=1 Tax=Fraxinus pennsylvanica TaxID=56036 RepID=A0AAD2AC14_9LAMI|nr:unnamed protein product [Fraxinus pennsylvanica]
MSLLVLPFGIPGVIYSQDWFHRTIYSSFQLPSSGFILVDANELELHKELLSQENSVDDSAVRQSPGYYSTTSSLITAYSSFSFFGFLLSAASDFIRTKLYFARTGWLAIALLPMLMAYFLLAAKSGEAVHVGTAQIGLTSGFIFAAAVSVTSELFGLNSVGLMADSVVCMGRKCYGLTFVLWGCISILGLASSLLLFL